MRNKFIHLQVLGVQTPHHGMLINSIEIGNKFFNIGALPYLEAFPDVPIAIGNIHLLKKFPQEVWERSKEEIESSLAELILQINLGEAHGIIGTAPALNALIEFCEEFEIADLSIHRLERFLLHPDLADRLFNP